MLKKRVTNSAKFTHRNFSTKLKTLTQNPTPIGIYVFLLFFSVSNWFMTLSCQVKKKIKNLTTPLNVCSNSMNFSKCLKTGSSANRLLHFFFRLVFFFSPCEGVFVGVGRSKNVVSGGKPIDFLFISWINSNCYIAMCPDFCFFSRKIFHWIVEKRHSPYREESGGKMLCNSMENIMRLLFRCIHVAVMYSVWCWHTEWMCPYYLFFHSF